MENTEQRSPKKASRKAFLLFLTVLLIGLGVLMEPFWIPAGLALVTITVLQSMHEHVLFYCRGRRYLAAAISVSLTSLLIMLPFGSALATIVVEIINFSKDLTLMLQDGRLGSLLDQLNGWIMSHGGAITKLLGPNWNLRETVSLALEQVVSSLYAYSPQIIVNTASFGFQVAMWLLFLFTFFADGSRLYYYFLEMTPIEDRHEKQFAREVRDMVSAVFLGMVANSIVHAILMGIVFMIFGLERPWMWALVTFGFAFIPVLGSSIIWGGGAFYLLLSGDWGYAVALVAIGFGIFAQIDNVVKPLVMRGRVDIHPVLLLLSILGGALSMGPVGLVFGPVFIALVLAALKIYRREYA